MARTGSHGAVLKLSDMAGTPVFTAIAQVSSVTPPAVTRGTTPAVDHDMSGGIEYLADALYDGGEVQLNVDLDPAHATHDGGTGLREAAEDGLTRDWQLVLPDTGATQYDFAGYVTGFVPGELQANTGKMEASVTIKVSGDHAES